MSIEYITIIVLLFLYVRASFYPSSFEKKLRFTNNQLRDVIKIQNEIIIGIKEDTSISDAEDIGNKMDVDPNEELDKFCRSFH